MKAWSYKLYKKVGTPADMRKREAVVIKAAGERARAKLPVPDGWKFGCKYAGRGKNTNSIYEIAKGEDKLIHEASPAKSYAPLLQGETSGDAEAFRAYKRLKRLQSGFEELPQEEVDEVIRLLVARSGPRVLVTAGHHMPYLHDVDKVRGAPVATLKFSIKLIEALKKAGKEVDLGIIVNDLHMGMGEGGDNATRKEFWENYRLPAVFQELIGAAIEKIGEFGVMVVGERVLYNRFDHMRKSDNPDPEAAMDWKAHSVQDTKCRGALAYFLKFAASTLGYESCTQIFPACDRNSRIAAQMTEDFYGRKSLPEKLHIVYTTIGC